MNVKAKAKRTSYDVLFALFLNFEYEPTTHGG